MAEESDTIEIFEVPASNNAVEDVNVHNLIGIVEISSDEEPKSANKSSISNDSDDIEIVDIVIHHNVSKEESNNVPCRMPFLNSSQNNSKPSENVNVTTDSSIQEIQIVLENIICEVEDKNVSENKFCRSSVIMPATNPPEKHMSVNESNTDSVLMSNALKESDACNNYPENYITKNNIEKVEVDKHELLSDSTMCDEIIDITDDTNEYYFNNIEYNFSQIPTQITGSWKEFSSNENNFTRGCKWAPDGSCILTCSDDNKLKVFNLPQQLWDPSQWCDISELEAVLRISEGDLIYDYCWYPLMNSNDVSTCCLASTSKKSTVHLWDAYTGNLRCSYRSYNHMDELVTPYSLSFDSDGDKLFCGFHNVIRIFDVNRPGRLFKERKTYAYKTGQCGIISCFAFTSADKNISAAGSYQRTIGLYSEPDGELTCLLEGQANGVTQLQFSPDGNFLYSGGRKDSEILCWDLRNLGTVLFSLRRSCDTNQRIYFDISRCGKYVVSGNVNGVISFWDVTKEPKEIKEDEHPVLIPIQFFLAHNDCVNGVSLHPSYPLLCSSSGQRKFPTLLDDDAEEIFSMDIKKQDNSLRLWWIGTLDK